MDESFHPQQRFTSRVDDYARTRPSYPAAVLDYAEQELRLPAAGVIADIGSGTGIFTRLWLARGYHVFAVEPNAAMRAQAERELQGKHGFRSVNGSAEATGLPDGSVDLVTAAQAFHWFDVPKARDEFARILRPPGRVCIVWNDRKLSGSAFLEDYELTLRNFALDYAQVSKATSEKAGQLGRFFDAGSLRTQTFPSAQSFNFPEFVGRVLSSSYVPPAGHPRHLPLLRELQRLFDQNQVGGQVRFEYDTNVYLGTVHVPPAT